MKTSQLIGPALDWAVAKCEGDTSIVQFSPLASSKHYFAPSRKWAQGGPIIEREGIDIQQVFCGMEGSFSEPCGWQAMRYTRSGVLNPPRQVANTPLIAAMRCYVTSKLGDEVEIPEELS